MECAVFAIAGVIVGALLAIAAKADFSLPAVCVKRRHDEKKGQSLTAEGAKSEEELRKQWDSLLKYSGDCDSGVRE